MHYPVLLMLFPRPPPIPPCAVHTAEVETTRRACEFRVNPAPMKGGIRRFDEASAYGLS
jgi:hypothetical protein